MRRKYDHLFVAAKKRTMQSIRAGDYAEADRWSRIAERLHRMEFRFSSSHAMSRRNEVLIEERKLRIEQMQKWPRGPR